MPSGSVPRLTTEPRDVAHGADPTALGVGSAWRSSAPPVNEPAMRPHHHGRVIFGPFTPVEPDEIHAFSTLIHHGLPGAPRAVSLACQSSIKAPTADISGKAPITPGSKKPLTSPRSRSGIPPCCSQGPPPAARFP